MGRLDMFDDFPGLRHRPQGGQQRIRGIDREPEGLEELGLPAIIRMSRIQQVVDGTPVGEVVPRSEGRISPAQFPPV
jgi:hypothetical protein